MERLALWTGLAFAGGLVLGALLLGGAPALPALPSLQEAPPEDAPRLARGSVTLEVVNEGREALDVTLEVHDDEGQRVFRSEFSVGPGGTVRRNLHSPVAGAYETRILANGVALTPEPFHTDECDGSLAVTFLLRAERGSVRAQEPAHGCL